MNVRKALEITNCTLAAVSLGLSIKAAREASKRNHTIRGCNLDNDGLAELPVPFEVKDGWVMHMKGLEVRDDDPRNSMPMGPGTAIKRFPTETGSWSAQRPTSTES
jgi:hypothetical protein